MAVYPLQAYRVVDFSWVWAGPLLGMILADMGAEVIKVETNKRLDSARLTPGRSTVGPETDFVFHSMNRNKLGITVDMSDPRGAELIKDLIKISDVAVENFSPKGLRNLGLQYETLSGINPKLVMISLPAAGQYGPLSDIVTYAPSLGALCGYSSLIGYPGERVLGEQTPYLDVNSAIHGAFAVMAALYYRERTGKGQYIDMAQIEVGASTIGEAFMEYFMNGRVMGTTGNRNPVMAPHNNYPCLGEGRWVSIAVKTDDEWLSFCNAIGNPPWTEDVRFSDKFNRMRSQDELDRLVSAWTIGHTDYEVMDILQKAGVAATPCLDLMERFSDPQFEARGTHLQVEHPATGVDIIAGIPFKLSDTPCEVHRHAPLLGEHNEYVFGELLSRTKEEIAQLIEDKVIY
ncbi:MAG: CoA transferase [Dehalococcoidia bacterium]|jgi:benzylsuccinate CoA-transferase BbsF subunit|nr:CoA transferase [Dehalococcoidia bacterium]